MKLTKDTMVYKDYKWAAPDDHDNPYYRGGNDHRELNRTEGYEMLYFINHIADKWRWTVNGQPTSVSLSSLQKIETMIRTSVPSTVRKREQIANWILQNWSKV